MSLDHEEETMYSDLLKAGEDPSVAAAIAGISRTVAETMTCHPERWMRGRIDEARSLRVPSPAPPPETESGRPCPPGVDEISPKPNQVDRRM